MSYQLGMTPKTSPAFRAVVASVDGALNREVPKLPENDLDWGLVRSIAHRHKVVPLVYEGLSAADAPPALLSLLRTDVQRNTKRNLQMTNELTSILDDFEEAGVRVIPFKGPVLSMLSYGDLGRRMFLDLDLLVDPSDVNEAGQVLLRSGYVPDDEFAMVRQYGHKFPLIADVGECSFSHARRGEVELRWRHGHWANPLDISFDEWWRRRETTTLAGRDVPVLSAEDRILLLATHGNKHAWRRLAWIADVDASLRAYSLDWDAVKRHARSWGVEPALKIALALSASLSGEIAEEIPEEILNCTRTDRRTTILTKRAIKRLSTNPLGAPTRLEEFGYDFVATASSRSIVRVIKNIATASIRRMV